ncbi:hypothetical protein ACIFUY_06570 [Streptomyces sp. CACIS-1.16CA]|uniref:hypothetical protein n=1 Tax=Streptomyces sp. CACIS-1.16CA TaxID=1175510 RepID=UPI0037D48915
MSTTALASLSDADTATVSSLASRRRASITVAQAEQMAADRLAVSLLSEYRAAASVGDRDAMSAVMLAAIDLDRATPGAPRLMDEIRGLSTPAAA